MTRSDGSGAYHIRQITNVPGERGPVLPIILQSFDGFQTSRQRDRVICFSMGGGDGNHFFGLGVPLVSCVRDRLATQQKQSTPVKPGRV